MQKKIDAQKKVTENLEEEDPWMKAKFEGAEESLQVEADAAGDSAVDSASAAVDSASATVDSADANVTENASVVEKEI